MSEAQSPSGKRQLPHGVRVVKKTISLSVRHHLVVVQMCDRWGVGYSEMLRRMIDHYNAKPEEPSPAPRRPG